MLEIGLDELEQLVSSEAAASTAPKYACLERAFEKCIRSGRFQPGARVPTEIALSERLPFGLGTVQRALNGLAQRGLVVRCRKTGTFIADRTSQASETHVYRFYDPATGKLILPFTRVLNVETDETDGPWRKALSQRRLIRIDRLVWIEQEPPAFSSVFVAAKHGKHLLNRPVRELHGSSWHRLLTEHFNLPTIRMEHSFGCSELDAVACRALLVPDKSMGMIWDITDFSIAEKPILFQRYQLPPGHRPIQLEEVRR